jgi:hypothetical protein
MKLKLPDLTNWLPIRMMEMPYWSQTPPRYALKARPNFNHSVLFHIVFPERFDAQYCGRYQQLENGVVVDSWTARHFKFKLNQGIAC